MIICNGCAKKRHEVKYMVHCNDSTHLCNSCAYAVHDLVREEEKKQAEQNA